MAGKIYEYLIYTEERLGTPPGDNLAPRRASRTVDILLKYHDASLRPSVPGEKSPLLRKRHIFGFIISPLDLYSPAKESFLFLILTISNTEYFEKVDFFLCYNTTIGKNVIFSR